MDTAAARSTHPLVIIAALAVTLFCLAGIAALMGWLPNSKGNPSEPTAVPATTPPVESKTAAAEKSAAAEPRNESPAHRVQRQRAAAPATTRAASSRMPVESAPPAEAPVQVAAADIPPPPPPAPVAAEAPRPVCTNCGVIESVRAIHKEAPASGLGAAAGGLLGGVVGHQLGNGRGRDLMTVVGAVGGAVAGHEVEKNRNQSTTYETTVRFDDGTTQRVTQAEAPAWRQGERVRVVNGTIRPI